MILFVCVEVYFMCTYKFPLTFKVYPTMFNYLPHIHIHKNVYFLHKEGTFTQFYSKAVKHEITIIINIRTIILLLSTNCNTIITLYSIMIDSIILLLTSLIYSPSLMSCYQSVQLLTHRSSPEAVEYLPMERYLMDCCRVVQQL